MESERFQMIFGLILLFMVINTTLMWAVISTIGTGNAAVPGSPAPAGAEVRDSSGSPASPAKTSVIVSYPNQTAKTGGYNPLQSQLAAAGSGSALAGIAAQQQAPVAGSGTDASSVANGEDPEYSTEDAGSPAGSQVLQSAYNSGVPVGDAPLHVAAGGFINAAVRVPDPRLNVARNPESYVTVEIPSAVPTGSSPFITHEFARQNYTGFTTVYRLTGERFPRQLPKVSFHLVNPPLIIDYNVTPLFITDVKYVEWKTGHTMHNETIKVHRAYEDAWFRVTVRDRDTGTVVTEDGVGRTDFFDEQQRQLVMRNCGNYSVEFGGFGTTVNLTVRVRNNGLGP